MTIYLSCWVSLGLGTCPNRLGSYLSPGWLYLYTGMSFIYCHLTIDLLQWLIGFKLKLAWSISGFNMELVLALGWSWSCLVALVLVFYLLALLLFDPFPHLGCQTCWSLCHLNLIHLAVYCSIGSIAHCWLSGYCWFGQSNPYLEFG